MSPGNDRRPTAGTAGRTDTSRADSAAKLLAEAFTAAPRYLETLSNGSEAWMRGRVLFVLPVLVEDYPPPIKAAIDRRRRASLEGVCDCGARWDITRRGKLDMAHEAGCVATDRALDELAAAHGMTFPRWAA